MASGIDECPKSPGSLNLFARIAEHTCPEAEKQIATKPDRFARFDAPGERIEEP
jgi:hypothetical protein